MPMLEGELKDLVDEKVEVIKGWMRAGKIARTDPWHLIFSIWATTQHYADFDVQVRAVLGPDRGGDGRFEDAARFLEQLFVDGLQAEALTTPVHIVSAITSSRPPHSVMLTRVR